LNPSTSPPSPSVRAHRCSLDLDVLSRIRRTSADPPCPTGSVTPVLDPALSVRPPCCHGPPKPRRTPELDPCRYRPRAQAHCAEWGRESRPPQDLAPRTPPEGGERGRHAHCTARGTRESAPRVSCYRREERGRRAARGLPCPTCVSLKGGERVPRTCAAGGSSARPAHAQPPSVRRVHR
jgi:hypothetical protein